jgi:hypothetical protein
VVNNLFNNTKGCWTLQDGIGSVKLRWRFTFHCDRSGTARWTRKGESSISTWNWFTFSLVGSFTVDSTGESIVSSIIRD